MTPSNRLFAILAAGILVLGIGVTAVRWIGSEDAPGKGGMVIPELSDLAARGKTAFDANCAACHGPDATGTKQGPPFVHPIYNPGHHSDRAFFLAAKQGVRRHHWSFGDMPPQPRVTDQELTAIVRYVRELQEANGIVYQVHKM